MKMENKRIFISDLPETITKDQLESRFSKFGQVNSVEIKKRKELGPNQYPHFAYVNLVADNRSLNQCFQDFSSNKFGEHYIRPQIAKENFLEKLKRERQEADQKSNLGKVNIYQELREKAVTNGNSNYSEPVISKQNIFSPDLKTDKQLGKNRIKHVNTENKSKQDKQLEDLENDSDIVIKNNRGKLLQSTLKIPSRKRNDTDEIAEALPKSRKNDCDSNLKRLQSLKNMKQRYAEKKTLIQSGLSNGAVKTNKKIIFNDDTDSEHTHGTINGLKKPVLFDESNVEEEDGFEANFDVKEHFQGSSGQKLLELQSRYKNDKRFNLDERFIEEDEVMSQGTHDDEHDLEAEKYDQLKILEDVLGKKIVKPINKKESISRKPMLKFDPTRPEHSNLVLIPEVGISKTNEKINKRRHEDNREPEPEVSKEIFYKVPESLKNVFEGDTGQFSLLSTFGSKEEIEESVNDVPAKPVKPVSNYLSQNPFKHDSSDEENEIENIPHKGSVNNASLDKGVLQQSSSKSSQSVFWTEPFFFKIDDFRLQEGIDFIEKIKTSEQQFLSVRRQVKEIVKSKVRHNERKNKMFKRKLGGSKKRKHIRIKKALKR